MFECIRCCLPAAGRMMAALSVLALVFLSFVAGGAVQFFNLPTADFMRKAFSAAEALNERELHTPDMGTSQDVLNHISVTSDDPKRTYDGFTLVTTTEAARATLLNMSGDIVHRWELPFSRAWPTAPHVRRPLSDSQIQWFRSYLYPDGDLLAVYHANGDTPFGYGLVKLDKDSNLRWTFSENVHHDVDVGEDGTIFTLTQRYEDAPGEAPKSTLQRQLEDYLVVLSPQGKKLKEISILAAFRDSPYGAFLSALDRPVSKGNASDAINPEEFAVNDARLLAPLPHNPAHGDLLHVNSVRVVRRALARDSPCSRRARY